MSNYLRATRALELLKLSVLNTVANCNVDGIKCSQVGSALQSREGYGKGNDRMVSVCLNQLKDQGLVYKKGTLWFPLVAPQTPALINLFSAQEAIAMLKSAIVSYMVQLGHPTTNSDLGRALGVHQGYLKTNSDSAVTIFNSGHITHSILAILERANVVKQENKLWSLV